MKTVIIEQRNLDALLVQSGDILLNEGGDRDKIGRGWVFEGQIASCVHQNHVFKARVVSENVDPYFVSRYLNEFGRRFFIDEGKQTTNLASISLTKISRVPVPVPPRAELEELLTAFNALSNSMPELDGTDASAALRQSILAAAFRGELA